MRVFVFAEDFSLTVRKKTLFFFLNFGTVLEVCRPPLSELLLLKISSYLMVGATSQHFYFPCEMKKMRSWNISKIKALPLHVEHFYQMELEAGTRVSHRELGL